MKGGRGTIINQNNKQEGSSKEAPGVHFIKLKRHFIHLKNKSSNKTTTGVRTNTTFWHFKCQQCFMKLVLGNWRLKYQRGICEIDPRKKMKNKNKKATEV